MEVGSGPGQRWCQAPCDEGAHEDTQVKQGLVARGGGEKIHRRSWAEQDHGGGPFFPRTKEKNGSGQVSRNVC